MHRQTACMRDSASSCCCTNPETVQQWSAHFSSMISSRLPTFMGAPLSSSTCEVRRRVTNPCDRYLIWPQGRGSSIPFESTQHQPHAMPAGTCLRTSGLRCVRTAHCQARTLGGVSGLSEGHTLVRSSWLRSSCGRSRSWLVRNSSSMSSQSFMRSSFSSRSLHFAFGVTAGSLDPRPAAAARRCLRPTRGGGGGGSHFFFFSPCNASWKFLQRCLAARDALHVRFCLPSVCHHWWHVDARTLRTMPRSSAHCKCVSHWLSPATARHQERVSSGPYWQSCQRLIGSNNHSDVVFVLEIALDV